MDQNELKILMEETLPPNVIQCLSLTGYDSPDVIAKMSTDGPGNSIDTIEKYILQEYPNESSCYHLSIIKHTHVFTPGHRIRLSDFIVTVRSQHLKRKRPLENTSNKRKSNSKSHETSSGIDASTHDLESIYNDIRRRIFQWVKKSDHMPDLKEQDDYNIKVKLNEFNQPAVSVYCALCKKSYKLNGKSGENFMLSNWTKHFDRCKMLRPDNQRSIFQFIRSDQTKSSSRPGPSTESKKSISVVFKPNSSDYKDSDVNECESHQEISDSEVSLANDCNSKLLSITKECENGTKISSGASYSSDEKVDNQKDSLVQLKSTSVTKEGQKAAAILLKNSPDRKQDFQEDSLAWVKQESH